MASLRAIIGASLCVILSSLLAVDGQGLHLLLGGLRGSGGGGRFGSGLFGGGGGKHHGGGDALTSLLAAGIIAKLFNSEPQKCHHHQEGRFNLYNFYQHQQRNAFLQHRNALLYQRNALFHPRYPHFHARYPYFPQNPLYFQNLVPKPAYLPGLQQRTPFLPEIEQKAPFIPPTEEKSPFMQDIESKSPYFQNMQQKLPETAFDPKAEYIRRRVAYLQQRRAQLYPMIPGYQASSESQKIPIISGLLTGFF